MKSCSVRSVVGGVVRAAVVGVVLAARHLSAQVVETPVPFDTAGRVTAVTPALAERLHLGTPGWPVTGTYREVRLFAVQPAGGYVLVIQREGGALERTSIDATQ